MNEPSEWMKAIVKRNLEAYRSDPEGFERETRRIVDEGPARMRHEPDYGVEFRSDREQAQVMRRVVLEASSSLSH